MNNKTRDKSSIYTKMKDLNSTINTMLDGVKHLEKMRSYNYLHSVSDEELQEVLMRMKRLEESLEKLESLEKRKKTEKKRDDSNHLLKAVGKNRKLLVTKPGIESKPPQSILQQTNKPKNNIISNSNTPNPRVSIDKLFDKNVTPESYHKEAKERAKRLAFKLDK